MTRSLLLITLALSVAATTGCEEIDEFNELLPLVEGARWDWDSDTTDALWFVEVAAGDGHDDQASFDYTFKVDDGLTETPQFPHDLYDGEEGLTEVDPSEEQPGLFLKLPASEGDTWDHENIGTGNESYSLMTYEGREDVSVPAGDFEQCWELSRDKTSTYGATEFTQLFVDWYCPAVGMVKRSMTNSDGETTILSLTSYSIPEVE